MVCRKRDASHRYDNHVMTIRAVSFPVVRGLLSQLQDSDALEGRKREDHTWKAGNGSTYKEICYHIIAS